MLGMWDSNYSKSAWSRKVTSTFFLCVFASAVYTFYSILPLILKFKLGNLRKPSGKLKWLQNDSSACLLPKLDPFDASIEKYILSPDKYNCTKKFHLLFYTDLQSNLILNKSLEKANYSSCCYKNLSRGIGDQEYIFSPTCVPIRENSTKIPSTIDFIAVYCRRTNTTLDFLVDLFGLIHLKPKVKEKITNTSLPSTTVNFSNPEESVNVVILGLDAISHMNFIRKLPKTYAFLTGNLSAISMHGFTKVGDSTFPNIYAALMGISDFQVSWNCKKSGYFDSCPLIWKHFSKKGYRTMYIEDSPDNGIFNCYDNGFRDPPTDYYLRPLMRAQDNLISHHPVTSIYRLCYGPRLSFEIILDYIKKAAYTFGDKERYFQFLWSSIISHDKLNNAGIGDDFLFNTLKWLYTGNYLNKTVLVLMSDHGMRYGSVRSTYQGSVEERMPYLFTVFPPWFTKKYTVAINNFRNNSKRLTTHFDVYETLKDLAYLENIQEKKISERSKKLKKKITRGISWFLPVPITRNCYQAAIPKHFCVCHQMKDVPIKNNTEIVKIGQEVVSFINTKISNLLKCSPLHLLNVTSARKTATSNSVIQGKINTEGNPQVSYVINILASPANATFEATVSRSNPKDDWVISEHISRTNWYGNESYCVTDTTMKKYCFCK